MVEILIRDSPEHPLVGTWQAREIMSGRRHSGQDFDEAFAVLKKAVGAAVGKLHGAQQREKLRSQYRNIRHTQVEGMPLEYFVELHAGTDRGRVAAERAVADYLRIGVEKVGVRWRQ